jgi:hypothetical protein
MKNIFKQFKTWVKENESEVVAAKINTIFDVTLKLVLSILLVLCVSASVYSALCNGGLNALLYALSALVIAFILRTI